MSQTLASEKVNFAREWYKGFTLPALDGTDTDNTYLAKLVVNSLPIGNVQNLGNLPVYPASDNREYRSGKVIRIHDKEYGSMEYKELGSNKQGRTVFAGIINIPGWYLSKEILSLTSGVTDPTELSLLSLSLINSTILHEALHFQLSPRTFTSFIKFTGLPLRVTHKWIFYSVAQIVEDVFIEHFASGTKLEGFFNATNSIYYNEKRFNEAFRYIKAFSNGVYHPEITRYIIDFLYCVKNSDLDGSGNWKTPFTSKLFKLVQSVKKSTLTVPERSGIMEAIYQEIIKFIQVKNQEENQKEQSETDKGEGSEPEDSEGESDKGEGSEGSKGKSEEEVAKAQADIDNFNSKEEERRRYSKDSNPEGNLKGNRYFSTPNTNSIQKQVEEVAFNEINKIVREVVGDYGVEIVNFNTIDRTSVDVVSSPKPSYVDAIIEALKHDEKKTRPSLPKRTGRQLASRELYKAGFMSDPKLFTDKSEPLPEFPEIIFLVDGSGSMSTGDLYGKCMTTVYHITKVLSAKAYGVFVHSTISEATPHFTSKTGEEVSAIYPFSSRNIGYPRIMANEEERNYRNFRAVRGHSNSDGYAITEVGSYFSDRKRAKVLFVLSDGEPSGKCYRGKVDGISHTRESVGKLRKEGITVISLSLVKGVVESNNEIYGKSNNFYVGGENNELGKKISELILGNRG